MTHLRWLMHGLRCATLTVGALLVTTACTLSVAGTAQNGNFTGSGSSSVSSSGGNSGSSSTASTKVAPDTVQSYSSSYLNATKSISDNWAGYVIKARSGQPTNNDVSDVAAQWTLPMISCGPTDTFSSTWVGIDGDGDKTVEQIGTDQDCSDGSPDFYAWFEIFPKPSRQIADLAVKPGDTVSAEVKFTGQNNFVLTLTNITTGKNFTVTRAVTGARRRSAEWIVEAPYSKGILPLTNFDTIQVSNATATFRGHTGPISDHTWSVGAITMTLPNGTVKAQPSGLTADGSGFEVIWHGQ